MIAGQIPIDRIVVPEGRRPLTNVPRLAASIAEIGLLHPITLAPDFRLVAGAHRLEACRTLGWTEIPATISDADPLDLALAEIDENLIRADLSVLEQGEHIVRRDALLVEKGMRAVQGENRFSRRGETVSPLPKTTTEIAAEIGLGERATQQRAQIATKIPEAVRDVIRDLPVADHTRDLLELARAAPAEQVALAAILAGGTVETVREARQEIREQRRADRDADLSHPQIVDAAGPFDLLYVDPPWRYEHVEAENRAIENHYPTMDLPALCALPIADIAAPDCVLFVWATSPKLAEAVRLIEAWGFTYRTCAVWVKDRIGMGYYFRQRHELLLVAVRGTPGAPPVHARVDSVIDAPRGAHSAKPENVYAVLEAMYPHARKGELFARSRRESWAAWGNQA